MVVVVHVDEILYQANNQRTMERFAAALGRKFMSKDTSDTKYCVGCHIILDRKAYELKL